MRFSRTATRQLKNDTSSSDELSFKLKSVCSVPLCIVEPNKIDVR
jgi:hypothetical protein